MPEVQERPMPVSNLEALRAINALEMPSVQADIEAEAVRRRAMFSIPAELIQAPLVVLCSVWPEKLAPAGPFAHGGIGRRFYNINPGSPENPAYLPLQNTFTYVMQPQGLDEPPAFAPAPITAASLATDLLTFWTGDHPGNRRGKKGIGVITGRPGKDGNVEATKAEIEQLVAQQSEFLKFLVERADELYDIGKRERITNEHRRALQILGLDQAQHPWFRSKVQLYNTCPRCAERILLEANFCKHCHTDIVKFFMEIGEVPSGEQWPTVVKRMDQLTKKKG